MVEGLGARAAARMRRGLLLLAVALVSGCLGAPTSPVTVVPYVELNDAQPGRATEFAFRLESTSAFRQELPVTAADLPEGWTFEPEVAQVDVPGRAPATLIVRVTPSPNATDGVHRLGVKVGETRADVLLDVHQLGNRTLAPGLGARVHYVLFLDNGTLLATNLKAAWDQEGVPRTPSNETPDWRPLKVYVGGRRGEAPPEPYNSTGCDAGEDPPCYHPVIPGFDARLRGMVAGETLAVRVAKEEAYTVPGNEEHPLYGLPLNFLVRVVQVDEFHVRACGLPVCP